MTTSLMTRERFREAVAEEESGLAAYLPRQLSITRFLDLADLAVRSNPDILKCSERSVIECLYLCARHSLEPGIEAYLVPFGSTCSFVLSYRGTVTLLCRLPTVQRCFSEVVYRADHFDLDYGRVQQPLSHRPALGERGDPLGAYGCVVLRDHGVQVHYMGREDITRIRHLSRLHDKGPWRDHEQEMWRKVALKVTAKQFPLLPALQEAFEAEEMPPRVVSAAQATRNIAELFSDEGERARTVEEALADLKDVAVELGIPLDEVKATLLARYQEPRLNRLTIAQIDAIREEYVTQHTEE